MNAEEIDCEAAKLQKNRNVTAMWEWRNKFATSHSKNVGKLMRPKDNAAISLLQQFDLMRKIEQL